MRAEELIAHIEEDDKEFKRVIEIMNKALADDRDLKAMVMKQRTKEVF